MEQDEIDQIDIKASIKSDHSAITLKIKNELFEEKGPGYWKFNSSLLSDENFLRQLKNNLKIWKEEYLYIEDARLLWDIMKWKIRCFTIKFSKNKLVKQKSEEQSLEEELNLVEEELNSCDNITPEIVEKYEKLKSKIDSINDKKAESMIFKSKAMWIEEGEKSSKYFFGLEKWNNQKKTIRKLTKTTGEVITDRKKILTEERLFYQKLYEEDREYVE